MLAFSGVQQQITVFPNLLTIGGSDSTLKLIKQLQHRTYFTVIAVALGGH